MLLPRPSVTKNGGGQVEVALMKRLLNFKDSPAHLDKTNDASNENHNGEDTKHDTKHHIKGAHDAHDSNYDASNQAKRASNPNSGNPTEVNGQIAHDVSLLFKVWEGF